MKSVLRTPEKFTETNPAVDFADVLNLQYPHASPPSERPKLDDTDSNISVNVLNYDSDMKKAVEKGDEGSESKDDWFTSKPTPEEDREYEIYKVKEEDKKPGGGVSFCGYCYRRGSELDHSTFQCPLMLKAWTKYCSKCHDQMNYGPCKFETGHEDALYDALLCCSICGCRGDPHVTKDCPRLKARGIDWNEWTKYIVL